MFEKLFLAGFVYIVLAGVNWFVDGRLFQAIAQLFS
jgi:hypothetical protein